MSAAVHFARRRREVALWGSLSIGATTVVLTLLVGLASTAYGAVTHTFLPNPSKTITEGVPSSFGGETPLAPGPVSAVQAMSAGGGVVWLADQLQFNLGVSRVDRFDAETGAYLGPQINEGEGVTSLVEGVGVGASPEREFVGAGRGGEHVVAVYGAGGEFLGSWNGANTLNKSFSSREGQRVGAIDDVAVDRSANPETTGDVYVATRSFGVIPEFNVVDVLKPGSGGLEGESVGQISGTCETAGIVCPPEEIVPFAQPDEVEVSTVNGDVVVLDGECLPLQGECAVDVFEPVAGFPGTYSFLFKIAGTPSEGPFNHVGSIAVDNGSGSGGGNIYVLERGSGTEGVVDEFDRTGRYLGRLNATPTGPEGKAQPFREPSEIAVDSTTENVFVGDFNQEKKEGIVDVFGPDVTVPSVEVLEPPSGLSPTEATLRGIVNPETGGPATCEFEYGTSPSFGQRARCEPELVGGSEAVDVESVPIAGLAPDTTYRYRLDARNANGLNTGECPLDCGEFTTPGPGISGESVSEVVATAATLRANLDPHGNATSYFFQYGIASTEGCEPTPESCSATTPVMLAGSAQAAEVSRHVQGLSPGTVYHYRLVAVSEVQPGKPEAFSGPDRTFSTQSSETESVLPDGRQWELVSPAAKNGALLLPIQETGAMQAAAAGNAMSYRATRPTEAGAQGYAEYVQLLSRRGVGGWSSEDIALPHSSAVGGAQGAGSEYRIFSDDLSAAVVEEFGEFTSLAPCSTPVDVERTPYIRQNTGSCAGRAGTYRPLLVGCPPPEQSCPEEIEENADVPPGTVFGGMPQNVTGEASFEGASGDLKHVVLSSAAVLRPPPHEGEVGAQKLYAWSSQEPASEALQLIGILPDGKLAPGDAQLGSANQVARGAISPSGDRVVWSEAGGHLYLRDLGLGKTLQLDLPQAGCASCGGGGANPQFQIATGDTSRVFFTDTQRLTDNSGELPGRRDLYECDIEETGEELGCRLSDVTPVPGAGESADVQGVTLGASSDGTWVYFVANGVLAPGASQGTCHDDKSPAGATCGLYVEHLGASGWEAPKLVATLGIEDSPDWHMTARVTSDGRFLAFMSDRPLTGYDSRDSVTGRPDEELFLYDRDANGGAGRVSCVSCDPSGARPVGEEYVKLRDGLAGIQGGTDVLGGTSWDATQGIAGVVPQWVSFALNEPRYQPRYLSDGGRLFFDSTDALVPEDVNGELDVYEYEPGEVGDCSSGSSAFIAAVGGCVGLVSSGTAAGESGFLDASESGNDVFFLTEGRLVRRDGDTALDLYDAHTCTAVAPCVNEVEPPPACVSADACRPPVSAQSEAFGTPGSATFAGPGNPVSKTAPSSKPKVLTRAQKLAAAIKACRKDRSRHKRATCERAARRRFAVKRSKRASVGTGSRYGVDGRGLAKGGVR